jgi:hypothetical protein
MFTPSYNHDAMIGAATHMPLDALCLDNAQPKSDLGSNDGGFVAEGVLPAAAIILKARMRHWRSKAVSQ